MSKKNEKKNQDIIDSFDYLSNAASTWDCTGPVSYTHLDVYKRQLLR